MGRKKRKGPSGKSKKPKIQVNKLKSSIQDFFEANAGRAYNSGHVIKKLGIRDKISKHLVPLILEELEDAERIRKLRNNSYMSLREPEVLTGIVDYVNPRFGYVNIRERDEDIWISTDHMNFAMDGDEVEVMLFPRLRKGKSAEGKVTKILNRGRSEFVGRVDLNPNYAFVIPDNRKMHYDIFVQLEDLNKAKNDDKVVVKIQKWPSHDKNPVGVVTEVLGPAGENEAEIHSIMAEFGLPFRFQKSILGAADKIPDDITAKEIKKRRDMRDTITFTIDPADAKDFDDALSFKNLDNGNLEIGIHIADVTHYLIEGSPLDKEAFERATSVYLVDRTIPMLPEKLSNELCSLRPEEEKLTFSAIFELDPEARVIKEWFGKTVIYSDRRFTYEEAQEILDNLEGEYFHELNTLNNLALKLRAERFMRGAMNFETSEVKFQLDKDGKPTGIVPKVRKDAHKLIEEFMLLANRKVAEFVYGMKKGREQKTFVYRTHDYPDPDKINAFSVFARKFGHDLHVGEDSLATSLNSLMDDIQGKPEEDVLQYLAIRSMAKAKYTTESGGHFGLAFPHYTHFTSPIRRYPDVMVHRLLYQYLNKGESPPAEEYEKSCLHSSEMEKVAAEAERASIKYKQVEFMQNMLGEVFDGVISGVTEYGIFVEIIETKCEGMVRVSSMQDDFYEFDADNFCLIGRRNKKIITLGDLVKVLIVKTDIDRRTIDLELVDDEHNF